MKGDLDIDKDIELDIDIDIDIDIDLELDIDKRVQISTGLKLHATSQPPATIQEGTRPMRVKREPRTKVEVQTLHLCTLNQEGHFHFLPVSGTHILQGSL